MSDEDDDDLDMSMNFMFNSAHAKEKETFIFSLEGNERIESISIDLLMIKGDPGHLQSGQYLWPASQALAEWMLAPAHHPVNTVESVGHKAVQREVSYSIVEMGSGCGLASLAMSHLHFVKNILITDYDPGVLDILNKNVALLDNKGGCGFFVENLSWGNELTPHIKQLFSTFFTTSAAEKEHRGDKEDEGGEAGVSDQGCSDCVVTGADLLYSVDVVSPLLTSVKQFLDLSRAYNTNTKTDEESEENDAGDHRMRGGIFVLVSSFDVGELINKEVALVCQNMGLSVREIRALDLSDATKPVCRVQYFSPTVQY